MSRVALVCSAHGLGHVTRQLALAESLQRLGARPEIFSAAPDGVIRDFMDLPHHPLTVDVGIAQSDALTHDLPRTRALLDARCTDRAIDSLAARLSAFDRVVVDIAPPALEAARRAGVPALAVGNFDWAWLYAQIPSLSDWARRFAAWQAPHAAAQLTPGPPLMGFREVHPAGLLGRRRPAARLAPRAVLVSFGGFGLDRLTPALPALPGVTWLTAAPMPALDRPDALRITGVAYPSLVAGCDAVLTKPGYGIFAETALAGTKVAYLPRGDFPEAPWLERALAARGDVRVEADLEDRPAARAAIAAALERLWSTPRRAPLPAGDVTALARRVLRITDQPVTARGGSAP